MAEYTTLQAWDQNSISNLSDLEIETKIVGSLPE